jgi:hypothetical protein
MTQFGFVVASLSRHVAAQSGLNVKLSYYSNARHSRGAGIHCVDRTFIEVCGVDSRLRGNDCGLEYGSEGRVRGEHTPSPRNRPRPFF